MRGTISASVSSDAIKHVGHFFDGSLRETLAELVQNARRAGAENIWVQTSPDRITIRDDGRGIDNPQVLLNFGLSRWSEDIANRENPAGMGVYSLTRRRPTIHSKTENGPGWTVSLDDAHFLGEKDALVEPLTRHTSLRVQGTEISFDLRETDGTPEYAATDALTYCPVKAFINNQQVRQADYLKNAEHTVMWNGLKIGVFKNEEGWAESGINFHGLIVTSADLPSIQTLENQENPHGTRWFARVDADDCPALELTLPTRDRIVDTAFAHELRAKVRTLLFERIAENPTERLAYTDHQRAALDGVTTTEPGQMLAAWTPPTRTKGDTGEEDYRPIGDRAFIIDPEMSSQMAETLHLANEKSAEPMEFFKPNDQLNGYDWYDRIPVIVRMSVLVSADNKDDRRFNRYNAPEQDTPAESVRSITVILDVTRRHPDDSDSDIPETTKVEIPADAALISTGSTNSESRNDNPYFVLAQGADHDRDELVRVLAATYGPRRSSWTPKSSLEDDRVRRRMRYLVDTLIGGEESAMDEKVRGIIQTCLIPELENAADMTIVIENGALKTLRRAA